LVPLYAREEENQTVADTLVRQQALASALAEDVADFSRLHVAAVTQLAMFPDLLQLSPARQHDILHATATAYPDVVGFGTIAANGGSIARADDRVGTAWVDDPVFIRARATLAPAVQTRTSPVIHRPVLVIGVPVRDADGQFAGMVSTSLESARIADLLRRADD